MAESIIVSSEVLKDGHTVGAEIDESIPSIEELKEEAAKEPKITVDDIEPVLEAETVEEEEDVQVEETTEEVTAEAIEEASEPEGEESEGTEHDEVHDPLPAVNVTKTLDEQIAELEAKKKALEK